MSSDHGKRFGHNMNGGPLTISIVHIDPVAAQVFRVIDVKEAAEGVGPTAELARHSLYLAIRSVMEQSKVREPVECDNSLVIAINDVPHLVILLPGDRAMIIRMTPTDARGIGESLVQAAKSSFDSSDGKDTGGIVMPPQDIPES